MDLAGYILVCLIWGSTWLAIKLGLEANVPPFLGAALRFLVASAIMTPLAWIYRREAFYNRAAWRLALITGFFSFFIGYGLNYWGGDSIPSGLSALTFSFFPIWVALLAHFMIGEKFSADKLAAIALGIAGIAVLYWGSFTSLGGAALAGMGWVTISVMVQGWSNLTIKRDGAGVPTLFLNAVAMGSGSFCLFIAAAVHHEFAKPFPHSTIAWGSIFYLGTFGSIATFMIYYRLLKTWSATAMALIAMITPPISVLLGHWLNHETLAPQTLTGGALVMAGVGGFVFASRKPRAAAAP